MKLLPYIIVFGFGIALGYVMQVPATFEEVVKFIAGGLSIGFIYTIYKEKKEGKLNHSKWLFKDNLNRLNLRLPSIIGLADNQTPDLRITVGSSYNEYINAHLESGYEEVWTYKKERDSFMERYNAIAPDFLDKVVKRIIDEIQTRIPSIIEWDGKRAPPPKYFTRNLKPHVGRIIYYSYERDIDLDYYFPIIPENNRWKIFMSVDLVESNNENEIQEIKQTIKAALEETLLNQHYKEIKNCYEEIKTKNRQFESGVDEIIKNVENNNPVKGHCKFCSKGIFP